jgi:hypothetical protein
MLPIEHKQTDPLFRFPNTAARPRSMGAALGFSRVDDEEETGSYKRVAGPDDYAGLGLGLGLGLTARSDGPLRPVPVTEIVLQLSGRPEQPPEQQLEERLEAASDTHAAAALLQLMEDPDEPLTQTRQLLLRELTCQDFGEHRECWLAWWRENHHRSRFEWLLDGLLHGEEDLRRQAAEELFRITDERFGYDARAPRRRREAARREYLEWWAFKRWQADNLS